MLLVLNTIFSLFKKKIITASLISVYGFLGDCTSCKDLSDTVSAALHQLLTAVQYEQWLAMYVALLFMISHLG